MRRFVFTFAATGLLFVFGPAAALAHHHSRSHHHARAHHAHIRRFGDVTSAPTTTSSADNVGTVASFTGGVLTIQLNDGSTVSGTVTNDTAIECMSSQSQSTHDSGDQGSGDNGDQSSGSDEQGDQASGSDEQGEQSSSTEDQGDQSSSGEDQGDASSSCSSADLTAGKTVHAAELKITSAGKTWDKVELGS
jgi:hypothetical protein